MDVTHWCCWITAAGTVLGIVAAVQQLLSHGPGPLARAVLVTALVGVAVAIVYPVVQDSADGDRARVLLDVHTAAAAPAPRTGAPGNPPAASAVVLSLPDPPPLHEVPPKPPPAETSVTLFAPVPAELAPLDNAPAGSAADNRTPAKPGTLPAEGSASAGFKPTLPVLLSAQQKSFTPAEVVYCPKCFAAYSAQGPTFGVKCPHCGATVNLVSDPNYMVHRCGKCGKLYRTTHFPPAVGPYVFRYYCSFCGEYHWFPN